MLCVLATISTQTAGMNQLTLNDCCYHVIAPVACVVVMLGISARLNVTELLGRGVHASRVPSGSARYDANALENHGPLLRSSEPLSHMHASKVIALVKIAIYNG